MAQPVKPADPRAPLAPSPSPAPLPSVQVAGDVAKQRIGQVHAPAAPLVGDPTAKYDFPAKIAEAYTLKKTNRPEAVKLFFEILAQANLPDCPADFAKNSLYYLNCLVGLAEAWGTPSESLAIARQALDKIVQIMDQEKEGSPHNQTLLRYTQRIQPFFSAESNESKRCAGLVGLLQQICTEEKEEVRAVFRPAGVPDKEKPRKATPTGSSDGSIRIRRLFLLFVALFLAGTAVAFYRRYAVQINPPSK